MLYVIHTHDAPDSGELRKAGRPAHLARLDALQQAGRLLLAGPMPRVDAPSLDGGVTGSLIVAEFASLEEAQAWWSQDPYVANGACGDAEIRPFIKSKPA